MSTLRVALAQLNVTVGDLEGNYRRIEQAIRRAQSWRGDLVVVPELAITGYPPEDLLLKPQVIDANQRLLARLVPGTRGLVAIVGYVDRDRHGKLYNAVAVLAHGRHVATYHKRYLPNYGVFDEKRYFAPGTERLVIEIEGVRIGLTICEDLWEAKPCQELARDGADMVINSSASPYHAKKLAAREALFARRARENRLAVAYCNLVGGQDELVFDGASLFITPMGRVLFHGAQFNKDFLIADLTFDRTRGRRGRGARVVQIVHPLPDRPRVLMQPRPTLPMPEEVYEALTLGVRDYVRKNGFSTVVLGLSGGIDSALTACIAVDALGPAHVVGLVMPSRYSSAATQADARQMAKALGMDVMEISIESLFTVYLETLAPFFRDRPADTTEQNIQARIRGNLLMALSNKFGWLVLTTGNKSEYATGYCTLYGDMAGGFAVIKDVPKTLVYDLARFRNRRGPGKPIPASIFKRAPTAELAPHQTDQDTLPPYDVLDRIITAYVEHDKSFAEMTRADHVDRDTVQRTIRMIDQAEYKRRQGPPGVKITPRAFGKDRRMPITNRYRQI